ncbi:MAG TPA: GYD domain-containing protein [Chloroflexota bacterium]|nr:GYD domain-containing protein [Chloroflexota bacterium]
MARYLIQAATIQHDASSLSGELASWAAEEISRLGGSLQSFDYTIGETNLVLLAEMPDEAALAIFSGRAAEAGKLRIMGVSPLISPERARRVETLVEAGPAEAETSNVVPFPAPQPEPIDEPMEPYQLSPEAEPEPYMPAALSEAAMPPGSYELTVGRFTRFSELGAFTETLHSLPGVRSVTTKQFIRGMVSLHVSYDSPIPLATRLRDMRQFKPEVRETSPVHLEMLVFGEARGETLPAKSEAAEPVAAAQLVVEKPASRGEAKIIPLHPVASAGLLHSVSVSSAPGSKTVIAPKRLAVVGGLAAAIAATVGAAFSA